MSHEAVNQWVAKAKSKELVTVEPDGTLVIQPIGSMDRGQAIVKIADRLFLWYKEYFKDKRDDNGMLIAPARLRALALNVAHSILKKHLNAVEG